METLANKLHPDQWMVMTVMMVMMGRTLGTEKGKKGTFLHHGMTTISQLAQLLNYPSSSPANVPKKVQDQFEYLFSLSKDKEYIDLLKLAADVPVRSALLLHH